MDNTVYLFTIGLGIGILISGKTVMHGLMSRRWPRIKARITESEIGTGWPGDGAQIVYKPIIKYQYIYESNTYENDTFDFSKQAIPHKEAAMKTEFFHVGKEIEVCVNPDKPQISVVNPGVKDWHIISLIICICLFCAFLYKILTNTV